MPVRTDVRRSQISIVPIVTAAVSGPRNDLTSTKVVVDCDSSSHIVIDAFAMLVHAQGSAIDKIDTNYMPKLDAILKDIAAAQAKTAKLLQAENRPDQKRALEANRDAQNLIQFAIMGDMFARAVLGIPKPTVGLLNVGSEEMKGHDEVKRAGAILRSGKVPIEFHGFIEGDDVTAGTVDVVVTDGFTGNVALKVLEGTVGLYTHFLREAFKSSMLARAGYALASPALQLLRQRLDPRRYNGAMFLGLNGIVVKSHGGTDALGFANAIGVAVDLVQQGTNQRITAELNRLEEEAIRRRHARAS